MTDEKKKMTAQGSSVGADDGQSISQITENSISTSGQKSNDEIVNSQDSLEEKSGRSKLLQIGSEQVGICCHGPHCAGTHCQSGRCFQG